MRYLILFVSAVLIFAGVVYLLTRSRRHFRREQSRPAGSDTDSDTGPFIVILLVSAVVALGTAFLLQDVWD